MKIHKVTNVEQFVAKIIPKQAQKNKTIVETIIKNVQKNHRSLHIFTCQIDAKLDKNKFIVPGLGDAGDRYMGT